MSLRSILFVFIAVDFAVLTAWAFLAGGDLGAVLSWLSQNPWGYQIAVDLCVAIVFGAQWMWQDAKALGLDARPYVALCLLLGSLGLLLYLVRRSFHAGAGEAGSRVGARTSPAAVR